MYYLVIMLVHREGPCEDALVNRSKRSDYVDLTIVPKRGRYTGFLTNEFVIGLLFRMKDETILFLLRVPTSTPFIFGQIHTFRRQGANASFGSSRMGACLILPLPGISILVIISGKGPSNVSFAYTEVFFVSSLLIGGFFTSPFASVTAVRQSSPYSILVPISGSFAAVNGFADSQVLAAAPKGHFLPSSNLWTAFGSLGLLVSLPIGFLGGLLRSTYFIVP